MSCSRTRRSVSRLEVSEQPLQRLQDSCLHRTTPNRENAERTERHREKQSFTAKARRGTKARKNTKARKRRDRHFSVGLRKEVSVGCRRLRAEGVPREANSRQYKTPGS